MPGEAVEKVEHVATGTLAALSGTPIVLGLVLINVLFIGALFYSFHSESQRKDELLMTISRECLAAKPKDQSRP